MTVTRPTTTSLWLPLLLCAGCFTGRTGGAEPAQDDGGLTDPSVASRIECGETVCTATQADVRWGAEPCCLEDAVEAADVCGLKADAPQLSFAGMTTPISAVLLEAKAQGEAIVDTDPSVECLPRNQAGDRDERCPTESFGQAPQDASVGDAAVDGGTPALLYEVSGCCRPDGYCGYLDPATDFGCVRISNSLVGKALGRTDRRCDE